jgi:aminopeptidase N
MSAMNVREVAFSLSKEYEKAACEMDGVDLAYYAFDEQTATEGLEIVKKAFAVYQDKFGAYAYESFALAQAGFCLGGMEYSGFGIVSDTLKKEEWVCAIAHEVAHQWWYAAVGRNQVDEAWQDEGLAEYSCALFYEKYPEYGVSYAGFVDGALKNYRLYADVYGQALGRWDARMRRPLKEFLSEYEYRAIVYDKSVVMWDCLRKSVGDKKFFAALKGYYRDNVYGVATPQHFIGAFEKAGVDVSGLVESFLDGKGVI